MSGRVCRRCGIESAPIHVHHMNGDHCDDRPENKVLLCANCHFSLHYGHWKLSDIGLPDVAIIRKSHVICFPSKTTKEEYLKDISDRDDIIEEMMGDREKLWASFKEREMELVKVINGLVDLADDYDSFMGQLLREYVNVNFYPKVSGDSRKLDALVEYAKMGRAHS